MPLSTPLENAYHDLNGRASEYEFFELKAEPITPRISNYDEEFIFVSLNTERDDCKSIFDDWLDSHPLMIETSSPLEERPEVTLHRVKLAEE